MSNYLGLFQFAVIASMGFAVLVAVTSALIYPLVQSYILALAPARRAHILLFWLVAPAFVGLLFTFLSSIPSFLSFMGIVQDDCTVHDTHFHLCLIHPPLPLDSMVSWVLMAFFGIVVATFFILCTLALTRAYKFHKLLMLTSQPHAQYKIRVVESNKPLAIAVGFHHMQVFISDYLLKTLSAQQLSVVLAHEHAHLKRKDGLYHMLGHLFSFAHLPWLRRRLCEDMSLASEQACDEAAAMTTGDRLYVAKTIVFLERLFSKKVVPGHGLSITGSNIQERVESLLREPVVYSVSYRMYALAVMALLFISLTAVSELHHQTEHILGLIVR